LNQKKWEANVPTILNHHGSGMIDTRDFVGRRVETEEILAGLTVESQAGLRQFSLERIVGYGVDYSDAIELRGRVLKGETWRSAATFLAETCLFRAEGAPQIACSPTHIAYLQRASALLRISQALMLSDDGDRRAIFARASELYARTAAMAGDCEPVTIRTGEKLLAGWLHLAKGDVVASVLVIGGIEGWAMDFDSQGREFAARGVDALLLDAPGQGETRFTHRRYLSADWREAFGSAIDYLDRRAPGRPIGIVGHSMGGSLAMAAAANDPRIRACCNNGGPIAPWMAPQGTIFFSKMVAFCGVNTADEAIDIWKTVQPAATGPNAGYPLLMVQGGEDPLVTNDIAQRLFDGAPTSDKHIVVFSDGDHCIYRHKSDRDILITDWMRARLTTLSE
jgi:alpha-beta hydrolase superfamily lysophospholipase